jgi:2'-5' RNA ligase
MTGTVRAFLAFEVPAAAKAALADGREGLRAELPRARWVRPEGQHLTLKFLGESSPPVLDALAADLGPRVRGLPEVTVTLAGAGFFPSPRRPRVAWVGGRADGADRVVAEIEETAARHGFEPEKRPWSLHLTQARIDRPWPPPAVERFLAWGEGLLVEPFVAREVVLFESTLGPSGAVYTALTRLELG